MHIININYFISIFISSVSPFKYIYFFRKYYYLFLNQIHIRRHYLLAYLHLQLLEALVRLCGHLPEDGRYLFIFFQLLHVLVHVLLGDHPVLLQVDLVPRDRQHDGGLCAGVELVDPDLHDLEGLLVGDVVNYNGGTRSTIIHRR